MGIAYRTIVQILTNLATGNDSSVAKSVASAVIKAADQDGTTKVAVRSANAAESSPNLRFFRRTKGDNVNLERYTQLASLRFFQDTEGLAKHPHPSGEPG